jgi:hypothetical protein
MIELIEDEKLYNILIRKLDGHLWEKLPYKQDVHGKQMANAFEFVAKMNERAAQKNLTVHFIGKLRDADTLNVMKIDDSKRYNNSGLFCILKIVEVKN